MCGLSKVVDLSEADVENGFGDVVSGTETVGKDTPGGNLQQVPYRKPSIQEPTTVPALCVHS